MPKVIDHDRRRREISEAARQVLVADGVAGTTVRAVAAASGWSPGAVRHYFPDHAALVVFAVEQVLVDAPARIEQRLRQTPSPEAAQLLLEELLPLDEVRRFEMQVWWATVDRARHDPGFDALRDRMWDGLRRVCEVAVAWLVGDERPEHELTSAAARLHALLDGLAVQCFCYPETMTPATSRDLLAAHLATLAPGRKP